MGYQSRRKLCSLAQGFIEGAAVHYGETLALEHPSCMLKGDAKCVFWLSFAPIKARSQARFAQAGIK
jgi:predicted hydrocarbon binding protein